MSEAHASTAAEWNESDTASPGGPRTVVLALILAGVALLCYANALDHPFVYDDLPLVLKNPDIRSVSNIPRMVGLSEDGFELKARWTRMVTYALEYAAVGPWPPLFHATNLVLHALVGLVIFALVARLGSRMLGFWSAALFLAHPINTEVVAHVAGRRELLAALFTLAAVAILERYLTEGGRWRVALGLAAVFLGVFSKEFALLGPVAIGMIDVWRRFAADPAPLTRALPRAVVAALRERPWLYALLAAFSIVLAWRLLAGGDGSLGLGGSPSFYETAGPGLGVLDRARIVGLAVRMALVPIGQSVDYSFDALGIAAGRFDELVVLDLAFLALGLGLGAWGLARRSWAGFGAAWFLLFFSPHLGIVPWHEVFAERFLYLPLVGVTVALAAGGLALVRFVPRPVHAAVAGAVVVALLGTGTVLRNQVWSSSRALWESAAARHPSCARAQKALGDVFMADARPDLAAQRYEAAVAILPRYRDAHIGVAVAQTALRNFQGGLAAVQRILDQWPDEPKAWNLKGYIMQSLGDDAMAMEAFQRAVTADPHFAEGYNNLAQLYAMRGDVARAITLYEQALANDPALVTALRNLATVYREGLGDDAQARVYEARLVELMRVR